MRDGRAKRKLKVVKREGGSRRTCLRFYTTNGKVSPVLINPGGAGRLGSTSRRKVGRWILRARSTQDEKFVRVRGTEQRHTGFGCRRPCPACRRTCPAEGDVAPYQKRICLRHQYNLVASPQVAEHGSQDGVVRRGNA